MREQLGKNGFALQQGEVANVVSVEVKQIKRKVDQAILLSTTLERGLKTGEIASTFMVECNALSIEDARLDLQLGGGLRKTPHAVGPVQTGAREKRHCGRPILSRDHTDLNAVSVELQLVDPVFARRGLASLLCELGLDEAGNRFARGLA